MIGSSLAKEEEFNIRLTLKGTASTTDPYFGEISAERERNHARIFSLIEDTKTYSYGHVGLNLVVPHKMLEERIKTFYQDEISQPLRFAPLLNLSTMAGKSIVTMIDYLKTQYTEAPEILDDPMVGTSFKELMIAAILGGMEHNYRDFHNTGVRDVATPHRVVLAEEYMKAHANEPVTVRVLAEQAACSERSLHNGFRKCLNKSPLTVLRDIRLENAHKDLVRGEASVTHTAFKWGFSNVGRFAKIYFLRFGEKPSQTLGSSSHKLKTAKY
jgi:AraC-like DNA-binding protein